MPVILNTDAFVHLVPGSTFTSYVPASRDGAQLCAWQLIVPAGLRGAAHSPTWEEVMLILDGELRITLDGVSAAAHPGEVILVPAGSQLRVDGGPAGATAWVTATPGLGVRVAMAQDRALVLSTALSLFPDPRYSVRVSLRVDYEAAGGGYAGQRRTDPRIEARVHRALGSARTVVNVGAGTGSYEPSDRWVLAVEPSALMRSQRPPGAAPAINGRAERLPLDAGSVDAAMAMITVHHWEPPSAGLRELRRVARGPVVVLTFDLEALPAWQHEYVGECVAADAPLMPSTGEIGAALGGRIRVEHVPVPRDCIDGFIEAYYARPEALLDPVVRASQSAWRRLAPGVEERMVDRLAGDLADGTWDSAHGGMRSLPEYDGALRLVISEP